MPAGTTAWLSRRTLQCGGQPIFQADRLTALTSPNLPRSAGGESAHVRLSGSQRALGSLRAGPLPDRTDREQAAHAAAAQPEVRLPSVGLPAVGWDGAQETASAAVVGDGRLPYADISTSIPRGITQMSQLPFLGQLVLSSPTHYESHPRNAMVQKAHSF